MELKCLCANYPLCRVVPSRTGKEEQEFPVPWSTNSITLLRQLLCGQALEHSPACLEMCLISDQSERILLLALVVHAWDWRMWTEVSSGELGQLSL